MKKRKTKNKCSNTLLPEALLTQAVAGFETFDPGEALFWAAVEPVGGQFL